MSVEIAAVFRTLHEDEAGRAALREIVHLAAELCGTRWAAISIRDGDEFLLIHSDGDDLASVNLSHSLCQHFMHIDDVAVVRDASLDDQLSTSPYVDGSREHLRFYATAPLQFAGVIRGRLCVFDTEPGDLDGVGMRSLKVLAQGAAAMLELRLTRESGAGMTAAEGEIARIAAEISHDMRAPLASILGNVELLTESPDLDPDTRGAMLRGTGRAGERLSAMVQQLLEFHRAGDTTERAHVDLEEVARVLITDLDEEFATTGAAVRVHPLPVVSGDPYQLAALLLNLVTNSLKFARPGVSAEVDIKSSGTGAVRRIHVIDNGVGIPPEKHRQVFRMFDRGDARVEGHGIGLATARRIVRAHGGEIGVRSDGESGTEIWFDLALAGPVPPQQQRQ